MYATCQCFSDLTSNLIMGFGCEYVLILMIAHTMARALCLLVSSVSLTRKVGNTYARPEADTYFNRQNVVQLIFVIIHSCCFSILYIHPKGNFSTMGYCDIYNKRSPGAWRSASQDGKQWPHKSG